LKESPFLEDVKNEITKRQYVHGWGNGNSSTWDYMSGVSQHSYLFSRFLVPESFSTAQNFNDFTKYTEWGGNFDFYNKMIFADAIDSIARIWLHVWIKYRSWLKE